MKKGYELFIWWTYIHKLNSRFAPTKHWRSKRQVLEIPYGGLFIKRWILFDLIGWIRVFSAFSRFSRIPRAFLFSFSQLIILLSLAFFFLTQLLFQIFLAFKLEDTTINTTKIPGYIPHTISDLCVGFIQAVFDFCDFACINICSSVVLVLTHWPRYCELSRLECPKSTSPHSLTLSCLFCFLLRFYTFLVVTIRHYSPSSDDSSVSNL